jgi:tetratricopeptide (TPR) repeat protein
MECGTQQRPHALNATLEAKVLELQRRDFIRADADLETGEGAAYIFKHALIQETAYESLLHGHRRGLHGRVAAALQAIFHGREEEMAGLLAYHFERAGREAEAIHYLQLAGDQARRLYANEDAIDYYSRALALLSAASSDSAAILCRQLYRSRGRIYELLGRFGAARQDHESALELARTGGDQKAEWQALLDLGYLWLSRSYERAGDYCQQALALARTMGDPVVLGRTLNRVGNWYLNRERPWEALQYHQEALAIFRSLNDPRDLAQTLDLLGVASLLAGDMVQTAAYYREATALFTELDDRHGLVSSITTEVKRGIGFLITLALKPVLEDQAVFTTEVERALSLARQIGWRGGESYALWTAALLWAYRGDIGKGLSLAKDGLQLAEEIGHYQWMVASYTTLSGILMELLAWEQARHNLEPALHLAQIIHSQFWLNQVTAMLARTYVAEGDGAPARSLLQPLLVPVTAKLSASQRFLCFADAELLLLDGRAAEALAVIDDLLATVTDLADASEIPALARLRGQALSLLGRYDDAEVALLQAEAGAVRYGVPCLIWPARLALGHFYLDRGRADEAQANFAVAAQIARELAQTVPDVALRDSFLTRLATFMPEYLGASYELREM